MDELVAAKPMPPLLRREAGQQAVELRDQAADTNDVDAKPYLRLAQGQSTGCAFGGGLSLEIAKRREKPRRCGVG